MTGDVYESRVFSFTHGVENHIRVAKDYLPKGARVLIIDDFLANGEAAEACAIWSGRRGPRWWGSASAWKKAFSRAIRNWRKRDTMWFPWPASRRFGMES